MLPSAIGNGTTTNNLLGESNYAADNSLKGKLKNFRIYNRALTQAQIQVDMATGAATVTTPVAGRLFGSKAITRLQTTCTRGGYWRMWLELDGTRISSTAIRDGSRLERAFRDLYTGTQHAFISEKVAIDAWSYEGQIYGVPYAIDFMNPAPDMDVYSLSPHYFEWAVRTMADMAVRLATARLFSPISMNTVLMTTSCPSWAVAASIVRWGR